MNLFVLVININWERIGKYVVYIFELSIIPNQSLSYPETLTTPSFSRAFFLNTFYSRDIFHLKIKFFSVDNFFILLCFVSSLVLILYSLKYQYILDKSNKLLGLWNRPSWKCTFIIIFFVFDPFGQNIKTNLSIDWHN